MPAQVGSLDLDQLAVRYRRGESIQALADSVAVSASTLRRRLLAAGVELRLSGTPLGRPDPDVLRQDLNDGLTPTEIAERYRVGRSAVSNWLTVTGLRRSPSERPTHHDLAELYQRQQRSAADVAHRYGVTNATVYNWLRQAAIPTHAEAAAQDKVRSDEAVRELYVEQELAWTAIARLVGCSTSTVARALERQHTPRRRRQPRFEPQALRDAIAAGCSAADIARQHDTAASTVYRALRRHGIDNPSTARRRSITTALQQLDHSLKHQLERHLRDRQPPVAPPDRGP
ncbi:MAG: hypothetical protein ACKVWR_01835 [Acidimicrobiales bacterium]